MQKWVLRLGAPLSGSVTRHSTASVHDLWVTLIDVTRMGEWSPECKGCEWRTPNDHIEVGRSSVGPIDGARCGGRPHVRSRFSKLTAALPTPPDTRRGPLRGGPIASGPTKPVRLLRRPSNQLTVRLQFWLLTGL